LKQETNEIPEGRRLGQIRIHSAWDCASPSSIGISGLLPAVANDGITSMQLQGHPSSLAEWIATADPSISWRKSIPHQPCGSRGWWL